MFVDWNWVDCDRLVFAAGIGVGYFGPRLLGVEPSYVSGPYDCPPCDDSSTTTIIESTETPAATEETTVTVDPSTSTPADQTDLFSPFWETWDLLHENYVDQPLNDTDLMRGAIEGMLSSLGDKHTSYMTPEEFTQANESLTGEYEGIGAYVDVSGDYVEIISPMKGSPAEAAGLRPNDKVIAIDGMDMTGTPGDLVLQQILGPAGTDVTLTIDRDGETFDVTITRQKSSYQQWIMKCSTTISVMLLSIPMAITPLNNSGWPLQTCYPKTLPV